MDDVKLDGGSKGAKAVCFVVAEGGGGREKAELALSVEWANDWKSAKSSSSSPNRLAAVTIAGRDDPGGGGRRGALTVVGFSDA